MLKALSSLLQIGLCISGYLYATSNTALAQVTSDGTVNTQVNQNGNVAEITGGETRDGNLFHSFRNFSVTTGNEAFFNNANDISNIFSRVTGGNLSDINGLIRANGSANLFLINPAGIIFGENARLDLGGSFLGSTSKSILFPNDIDFSATDTQSQPKLTINAPIGLGFRDEPGNIVNRSTADGVGLRVSSGETISLIGGDVKLEGGLITAPGGIVNLGGLTETGIVDISNSNFGFRDTNRSNVSLSSDAEVSVAANGGGFINVNVSNLSLSDNSELIAGIAENMGSVEAQAGDINIDATESVKIIGSDNTFAELQTGIRNNVGDRAVVRTRREDGNSSLTSNAIGNGGTINLNTKLLEFENNGKVSTVTYGRGNAGNINIAAENISLFLGIIESFAREGAIGNSGNIIISATDTIFLHQLSAIQAQVFSDAEGDVGNININTGSLVLNESSFIQADTKDGVTANAGDITINAKDSIALNGKLSLIISQIEPSGTGDAGEIKITAPDLSLSKFSLISTNVKEDSVGRAGNIFLDVDNLNITDGAIIDSLTENNFQGGNISVNADRINLRDGGKIVTSSNSKGDAGNIELNVTDTIAIDNNNPPADSPFVEQILQNTALNAGIFASTLEGSTGSGGSINVRSGSIELVNNGSISAFTQAGVGGNITLQTVDNLTLDNNSSISAEAFNDANGGNLNIDSRFIIAFPNGSNDILASAEAGTGGNIEIDTESLLGIQQRSQNDSTNDIDASSRFNLDGEVNINILNFNPIRGTIELPRNVVEVEETVAQVCGENRATAATSKMTVTGKGGIAPSPELPLNSADLIVNDRIENYTSVIPQPIETAQGKKQLARGVAITASGEVILTAYPTDNAGDRLATDSYRC